ncbi:MAG: class I SAM-dependent methyltransferase [Anaerolineae bacterium]
MSTSNPFPCPACGATATRPWYWKPADGEISFPGVKPADVAGYQMVRCVGCGLGRVDPLPGDAELKELYAEDYFGGSDFSGGISDALVRYRRYSGPPALQALRAANERAYEAAHAAHLGAWYGQLGGQAAPPRFLDVGCGAGGVLAAGKERGWRVVGVELSQAGAALTRRRGLNVINSGLAHAGLPDASFDIIHIREVLEHVVAPMAMLREARRLLTPGGMLYVQVPNDIEGYRARLFRRVWWLIPPLHVWYFTSDTLERMLRQVGLTARVTGTLGLGVGYDGYRYLAARAGVLAWLDAHEDGPAGLAPRSARAAFRAAGAPADRALDRARRHSSLWVCATATRTEEM